MEIKINREIRNYTESMFFGLSMRQFIFSVLACSVAVGLYFILRPYFGVETLSWMCILGAAPFAMLGFITYHGMTAEQFIWAWLRSEMLEPKEFKFEDSNYYYAALKDTIEGLQTGRPVKLALKRRPAIDIVVLQRGFLGRECRQMLREAGLEHEAHGLVQLFGLQLGP